MSKLERRIQWFQCLAPWLILAGVGLLCFAATRTDRVGVITAWMAIMAGLSGLAVEKDCRSPRARRLLAAILLPFIFAIWLTFEFHLLHGMFLQQRMRFELAVDASLATALLWEQCRYLVAVFRLNRRLSRRPQAADQ
jgi:hypothetical protein